MSNQKEWGFTIIELILFLGVTGALFAGLMVGVNTSINTQRYKESATSYKSFLEEQYSHVVYPRNTRDDTWACNTDSGVVSDPSSGVARGTSGCVLLGRYIEVKDDGARLVAGDVVGIDPGDSVQDLTGDLAVLRAYSPRISPIDVTDTDVNWQSRLEAVDGTASEASFLILRSPLSGIVRTFGMNQALPGQLTSALNDANAVAVIENCVVPSGYVSIPVQSVTVNAAVGSANGIVLEGHSKSC